MKSLGIIHHLGLGDFINCNGLVRYILKNTEYEKIYLISKKNYFEMIDYMYRDEPLIEVLSIQNLTRDWEKKLEEAYSLMNGVSSEFANRLYTEALGEGVSKRELYKAHEKFQEKSVDKMAVIGFGNFDWAAVTQKDKTCWQVFYDQMKIPHEVRKRYYKIERDNEEELRLFRKLNPREEPFAFVHEEKEKGYNVKPEHINNNLKIIKNDPTENIFHFAKIIEEAKEIHCMESVFKNLTDVLEPKGKLYFHDFRGISLNSEEKKRWIEIDYEQKFEHYSQS